MNPIKQSLTKYKKDGPSLYGPDHDQRQEKSMDQRIFNITRKFPHFSNSGERCCTNNQELYDQSTDNSIKISLPPNFVPLVPGMFPRIRQETSILSMGAFDIWRLFPPFQIQCSNRSARVVKAENLPPTSSASLPLKKMAAWACSRSILKLPHHCRAPSSNQIFQPSKHSTSSAPFRGGVQLAFNSLITLIRDTTSTSIHQMQMLINKAIISPINLSLFTRS